MSVVESFVVNVAPFGESRTAYVYLPNNYSTTGEPLPVIYFCDGQNLFDKSVSAFGVIWNIGETMDEIYRNTGKSAVVVGLCASANHRNTEYSPWHCNGVEAEYWGDDVGGEGHAYAEFLAKSMTETTLQRYNVSSNPKNVAVAGSSMGGLISCYIAMRYNDVFGYMGLFSSAVCFNRQKFGDFFRSMDKKPDSRAFVYCGGNEQTDGISSETMLRDSFWLYDRLTEHGVGTLLVVDSGGIHNEISWAKHFGKMALDFLCQT